MYASTLGLPAASVIPDEVMLTTENLKSLRPGVTFRENNQLVNGLSFNDEGTFMVTSSDDDTLTVYDCIRAIKERKVILPRNGCSDVRFLHHPNNVLLAARKAECTVRHLSLHDNKFIRLFAGHTLPVSRIVISPDDDRFITTSGDKTVRFWDIREQDCTGLIQVGCTANVAMDPEGLVFALAVGGQFIKLYDMRYTNTGAFSTFDLAYIDDAPWTDIVFSYDGKSLLIVTTGNHLRLIDAFDGRLTHTLTGHTNEQGLPLRASFTPDSSHILCGSSDGEIVVWSRDSGTLVHRFKTDHTKTIQMVDFNPQYLAMASTSRETKLWYPNDEYFTSVTNRPPDT